MARFYKHTRFDLKDVRKFTKEKSDWLKNTGVRAYRNFKYLQGITVDRAFEKTKKQLFSSINLIQKLAGTVWKADARTLRTPSNR